MFKNTQTQYLMVLCSFREQLQQHVREHAVEAVMACREIEQSLQELTGTFSYNISYTASVDFNDANTSHN